MIKSIITSKNTDYSIFLQCDCSNEILWFYYYHRTTTCEEIIMLDYFGYLKNEEDNRYRYFAFTNFLFNAFIDDLIKSQDLKTFYMEYYNKGSYLILEKTELGFYNLYKYSGRKNLMKKKRVWDISIREPQMSEFINELKNMQKEIKKWDGV